MVVEAKWPWLWSCWHLEPNQVPPGFQVHMKTYMIFMYIHVRMTTTIWNIYLYIYIYTCEIYIYIHEICVYIYIHIYYLYIYIWYIYIYMIYNIYMIYIYIMYISTFTTPIYALPGLRAPAAVGPFVWEGAGAAATPGRVLQGATKGAESGRQIPWGLGENHGKTDGKWGKKHGKLPEFWSIFMVEMIFFKNLQIKNARSSLELVSNWGYETNDDGIGRDTTGIWWDVPSPPFEDWKGSFSNLPTPHLQVSGSKICLYVTWMVGTSAYPLVISSIAGKFPSSRFSRWFSSS